MLLGAAWIAAGCSQSTPAPPAPEAGTPASPVVQVYYFHRNIRCPSCIKLEALAHQAIEAGFAGELAAGTMAWQAVNIDEEQNKHFEQDYALQAQSVVLSAVKEGKEVRWKNLDRVWDLLEDDPAFIQYVQEETHAFME